MLLLRLLAAVNLLVPVFAAGAEAMLTNVPTSLSLNHDSHDGKDPKASVVDFNSIVVTMNQTALAKDEGFQLLNITFERLGQPGYWQNLAARTVLYIDFYRPSNNPPDQKFLRITHHPSGPPRNDIENMKPQEGSPTDLGLIYYYQMPLYRESLMSLDLQSASEVLRQLTKEAGIRPYYWRHGYIGRNRWATSHLAAGTPHYMFELNLYRRKKTTSDGKEEGSWIPAVARAYITFDGTSRRFLIFPDGRSFEPEQTQPAKRRRVNMA